MTLHQKASRFCLITFLVSVFYCSTASSVAALPRFSLLTGTRCSACHYNPQGSGLRTELGWQMMNQTGLFQWMGQPKAGSEADFLAGNATNMHFDGKLAAGGDARLQTVKSADGSYRYIPMQLSLGAGYTPFEELTAYANINLASIAVRARNGVTFPGQTDFDGALQYQPSITSPSIRIGMIQPSVGIRQDDHTVFVRRDAGKKTYLLPAYYNDLGAEITYEGLRWLTLNVGLFNAKNLSQLEVTLDEVDSHFSFGSPTVSGRVVLWPQLLDEGLNGETGVSLLMNGDFYMVNGFAGIGMADKATLYLEGMYSKNKANRILRNFTFISSYKLVDWLSLHWRYEWGQTELFPGLDLIYAQQIVAGLEFFPLPYIELRPEYRLYSKQPFGVSASQDGSFMIQLHAFY